MRATAGNGETAAPQSAVVQQPSHVSALLAVVPTRPKLTWRSLLLAAWTAIVVAQVARLAWQRWRLSRLLRRAESAPENILAIVQQAAADIGLRRVPPLLIVDENCSPFACGIVRPRIVLPRTLLAELTTAELRQTLSHELAHIARADLAWIWPGQLARIAYFFNPFVHFVANQIRLERELACDQWVVSRAGHEPNEYMQTLIHIVSHLSDPSREAAS
jgi:bla regulator protein BlaR1